MQKIFHTLKKCVEKYAHVYYYKPVVITMVKNKQYCGIIHT